MSSETPIRILLVEDNPGDVRLLRESLREGNGAGFELEVVDRLSAGLERLAKGGGIDLVLLDLGLSDCRGLETVVRARAAASHLPLIVLTTLDDEAVAVQAVQRGAQDYLVKGQIESRLLTRAIRYAIERKRAEVALADALKERESIMETIPDILYLLDLGGNLVRWNRRVEIITGFSPSELRGRPALEFFPEEDRAIIAEAIRTAFEQGYADAEGRLLTKDGTPFPYHWTAARLADGHGNVIGLTGVGRDITERKRAEAERARYTVQLQGLAEASVRLNAVSFRDAVLQVVTEQAREIIGAHQSVTSLTDGENWAQSIHAISLSDKYAAWREYKEKPDGSGIYRLVCQMNRPMRMTQQELEAHPAWRGFGKEAGKHPPMRGWLAAPINGPDGQNIGLIQLSDKYEGEFTENDEAIFVQLAQSASVALENAGLYEQQRMAAIQLEAKVEDRTRELTEAMILLEAASKHKSEFLANMSHELRTPLNSILGFSELLGEPRNGALTEKQGRFVHNIRESGKHLLRLINDLLDLSKVEAGKIELRIEAFDLREAMAGAITEVRPQSLAKSLEVALQVYETLSRLTADPVRFRQILLNLLSNAIKFTPNGGSVTVTARQVRSAECGVRSETNRTSHLAPRTLHDGEFVEIAVADTGVGIKAEDLPKLFQPFTQLEGSFIKLAQGTGLGLALTKRLVELHGGTIWAASAGEGQGSTFTVRLPLTPPGAP